MVGAGDAVERAGGDGDDLLALQRRGHLPRPAHVVVGAWAVIIITRLLINNNLSVINNINQLANNYYRGPGGGSRPCPT